jgi:protocatechuate 3,4-dioxygenase, alpha subunit
MTSRATAPLALSPSQTVGPYLAIGLTWPDGTDVVPEGTPWAIRVFGRLLDGNGEVVPDGMIETWQADPDGRFDHPDDPRGAVRRKGFRGFGRCATGPDGDWYLPPVARCLRRISTFPCLPVAFSTDW